MNLPNIEAGDAKKLARAVLEKEYKQIKECSIFGPGDTAIMVSRSRANGNRSMRIKREKEISGHSVTLHGTLRINEPRKPLKNPDGT